jgi:pyrimidine-nucleoside phosphorylase
MHRTPISFLETSQNTENPCFCSTSLENSPLNAVEIITRKRDGEPLSDSEIAWFVERFSNGIVPDYQVAAWAMAVFLNGMNANEVASLTREMLNSGASLEHADDGRPLVDKHSTGGIGDKTSLVLAPLLACCDLRVPMLSGRGLGPTGGTLDKLESIPGFRTDLSIEELQTIVHKHGCVITGASKQLAPADRKLYALRDVTATVPSVPMITASIMSKKLAESLDALVLDVKFGTGAFMKSVDDAKQLAESLAITGANMGLPTTALLTDMNQPLGRMVGNAVEVQECVDFLRGEPVSEDLAELTYQLAAELVCATKSETLDEARSQLTDHISSGRAMERFEHMVSAQGGSTDFKFDIGPTSEFVSDKSGYVAHVDAEQLGFAIIELGGGRKSSTDKIDHSTGFEMLVRIGDKVDAGQPLLRVFSKDSTQVFDRLRRAITITDEPPEPSALIIDRIIRTP